jgi:hypothetical protein
MIWEEHMTQTELNDTKQLLIRVLFEEHKKLSKNEKITIHEIINSIQKKLKK